MMKKVISGIVGVMLTAVFAFAEIGGLNVYDPEDGSYALQMRYTGKVSMTNNITCTWTAGGIFCVTNISASTTVASGGSTALSTIKAGLAAATNISGTVQFECRYACGLAADVFSNCYVAGQADLKDGKWHNVGTIDTSATYHFNSCYINDGEEASWLQKVYGCPGGTGNVTVAIYIDGTEVYEKLIVSPKYVLASADGMLTNNPTASDEVVFVNETFAMPDGTAGIYLGPDARVHTRFTRATSATMSGGCGMLLMKR